ncbi:MAG TPA: TIGR01777 family oxidoreductase [Flavobacterium sp.]|nr:TIGR01777 family oxidoreductase [Flavobacterium sp.]
MKIIIAGGSGFIGRYLSTYFSEKGNQVIVLSRGASQTKGKIKFVHWDGENLSDWKDELEAADVLINLSGKSVAIRYTEKNKKEIYNSRIDSTRVLNKAVRACEHPPKYWFNSSGASMYKTSFTQSRDEHFKEWEDEFLTEVVLDWEKEFFKNADARTHKVAMRTSVVLGKTGETYEKLNLLSKIGLGGKQGSGKQIMSWIHLQDYARIIDFCMDKNLDGVINMASPNPVSNAAVMKAFREVNHMPIGIPTPAFLLKIGAKIMGIEPDLVLKSYNVVSKRLDENGFSFQFPNIKQALTDLSK